MPATRFITEQNSFSAGQLGEEINTRYDLEVYYQGASLIENCVVLPQGGLKRRPGERRLHWYTERPVPDINGVPDGFRVASEKFIQMISGDRTRYIMRISHTGGTTGRLEIARLTEDSDLVPCTIVPNHGVRGTDDLPVNAVASSDDSHVILSSFGDDTSTPKKIPSYTWAQYADTMWLSIQGCDFVRFRLSPVTADQFLLERGFWSSPESLILADTTLTQPYSITLHGGRLWLGGFPEAPTLVVASAAGVYTDFRGAEGGTDRDGDDEAFHLFLPTPETETITSMATGQHIVIFTSNGEYACTEDVITRANVFFTQQSAHGARIGNQVINLGDSIIFVQSNGRTLNEMTYSGENEQYKISPLTELAPNIINDPISISHQYGLEGDSSDRVFVVNADGTVSVLCILEQQDIKSWCVWTPISEADGNLVSRPVGMFRMAQDHYVMRLTKGTINWHFTLNLLEEDLLLQDASLDGTLPAGAGIVHQNIYRHGVNAHYIGLRTADSVIGDNDEVGYDAPIRIRSMPLNPTYQQKSTQYRLKKVVRLFVQTIDTTYLQATYLRARPFPLLSPATQDMSGPNRIDTLHTGTTEKRFFGYRRNSSITFTQQQPGPLHLLGYALEIQSSFVPVL